MVSTTYWKPTQGPTCLEAEEHPGDCGHESCERIDNEADPTLYENGAYCGKHGWQAILEFDSTPGFCAGRIYWANLACGCQLVEDCSYLEV